MVTSVAETCRSHTVYIIYDTLKRFYTFVDFIVISNALYDYYILVNGRRKSRILDVQYFRGAACSYTGGWESERERLSVSEREAHEFHKETFIRKKLNDAEF